MKEEEIKALGYKIVDIIAEEITHSDSRPPRPVYAERDKLEVIFGGELPEEGTSPDALLEIVQDKLLPLSPNHLHSGLFSHISSAALPFPSLMEALVASLRLYNFNWSMSPASSQIELSVINWLGQFVGYSEQAAGYVTTGGTTANLIALLTARVHKVGKEINTTGVYAFKGLTAYVSETAHACLDQSMRIMGLGSYQLRKIPIDQYFKVKTSMLEEAIIDDLKQGYEPFCVIGIAGSTDTGAVDDLVALSSIAKKYHLWFHVDGAYGAFAASLSAKKSVFAGIDKADSLVCDPHKWLNIPFEAGVLLVKNWQVLKETFSISLACLESVNIHHEHNQWEHGFELTRSDRALKIWLAFRQYGASFYRTMIAEHISLTEYLVKKIRAAINLELIATSNLSICCFRYINKDMAWTLSQLNELNETIENLMQSSSSVVIGLAKINDQSVLRACIVSHKIKKRNVDNLLNTIVDLGNKQEALWLKTG